MSVLKVEESIRTVSPGTKAAKDIPVGEVFYGSLYEHGETRLLMKVFGQIVCLTRSEYTYSENILVFDYRPVKSAVLTVTP